MNQLDSHFFFIQLALKFSKHTEIHRFYYNILLITLYLWDIQIFFQMKINVTHKWNHKWKTAPKRPGGKIYETISPICIRNKFKLVRSNSSSQRIKRIVILSKFWVVYYSQTENIHNNLLMNQFSNPVTSKYNTLWKISIQINDALTNKN